MLKWSGKILEEAERCLHKHGSTENTVRDAETSLDNILSLVEVLYDIRENNKIELTEELISKKDDPP